MKSRLHLFLFCCCLTLISCQSSSNDLDQGNKNFSSGLDDDAALLYKKAIQKDTRNGEAYYRLGFAEQRRGNSREALRALSTARQLLPNREDVQTQFARFETEIYLADPTPARPLVRPPAKDRQTVPRDQPGKFGTR